MSDNRPATRDWVKAEMTATSWVTAVCVLLMCMMVRCGADIQSSRLEERIEALEATDGQETDTQEAE